MAGVQVWIWQGLCVCQPRCRDEWLSACKWLRVDILLFSFHFSLFFFFYYLLFSLSLIQLANVLLANDFSLWRSADKQEKVEVKKEWQQTCPSVLQLELVWGQSQKMKITSEEVPGTFYFSFSLNSSSTVQIHFPAAAVLTNTWVFTYIHTKTSLSHM